MKDFFKKICFKNDDSSKSLGKISGLGFVFPFVFGILFFSCSNVNLEVSYVQNSVVFEYADDSSAPLMRLSVFAETSGDERRGECIRIVHEASGLEWVCTNPRKISDNGSSVWAGYTNFVPASDDVIPQGRYTFFYNDMSGEICENSFVVAYPDSLTRTSASQIESSFNGIEKCVALYDEQNNLLYFGPRQEEWSSDSDIKQSYGLATKIRVCYRLNSGSVVCMLEKKDL